MNETNTNNLNNGSMDANSLGAAPNVSPEPVPQPSVTPDVGSGVGTTTNPNVMPQPDMVNPFNANPSGPEPVGTPQMETPTPVASATPNPEPMTNNSGGGDVLGTPVGAPTPNFQGAPASNLGAIEQPIPGTSYNANPTNNNVNSNAFVETNKVENFGTEPPVQDNKGKKKPNKILFIIIIVLLLLAIAYGVYYYLSLGKNPKAKVNVTFKTVQYNVNEILSTNIEDYATVEGTDIKNCNLNTMNVDTANEGNYEYTITCGEDIFKGQIEIVNNVVPSAVAKSNVTSVNSGKTYTAQDFVVADSCTSTNCTYEFAPEVNIETFMQNAGNYNINVNVTDDKGKTGLVSSELIVLAQPTTMYLSCQIEADITRITDNIAIASTPDSGLIYNGYAYRVNTYTFGDANGYNEAVGLKPSDLTYNNITGQATYNDEALSFDLKYNINTETLNAEAGGTFPTSYLDIQNYYTQKGYTCSASVATE